MMAKHSVNKERRVLYRGNRIVNGYHMCHLDESVDTDQDTRLILTIGRKP